MNDGPGVEKICAACGRPFAWRRKWKGCWDQVKYCSDRCRRKRGPDDRGRIEAAVLTLLRARARGATICPSEAARTVWPEDWRGHMEEVRAVARLMMADGRIEITQRGRPVSDTNFRGPVRLRLSDDAR